MSSAFVKEEEYQQLKDVTPNMSALLLYLRRENGGPVREVKSYERDGRELHEMSDGLTYALNEVGQWSIIIPRQQAKQ
jgi:hypothetical protein